MSCFDFSASKKPFCLSSTKHLKGIQTPEPHWFGHEKNHSKIQKSRNKLHASWWNKHFKKVFGMGIRASIILNNIKLSPKLLIRPLFIIIEIYFQYIS